jgi:TRAP transporter 4TM/12TM fusion protein
VAAEERVVGEGAAEPQSANAHIARGVVYGLAVTLTCAVIAVTADLFRRVGISLYSEQYLAGLVALAMPLLFLYVPANGQRGGRKGAPVPWYDVLAALVSFAGMIYVAVRFPALSELVSQRPWDGLIVAAVMILLILEGLRRTTGNGLLYTTIFFFVLALVAGYLPGEFAAKSIPLGRLTYYAVWDSTAVLGVTLKIVATVVVVFVLFGQVLMKSGGAAYFTDISMALMGKYRGGPAKIAILGSSLFGTISGNVVSNIITVGVVTIPLMVRVGFRPHLAAAIEANASTGGQIMPPVMGIAAFVMAEFLQVPYADVALAAAIPAILFYIALFIQVDLEAARSNIKPMDPAQIPKLRDVLKGGWHFPIPFAVLVYLLFWGGEEADGAGLWTTAVALVLAIVFPFQGKRIGIRDIVEMLRDTGIAVVDLFMIGAASGIMIGALNYSGAGFTLSLVLIHMAAGSLFLLLVLSAIANIILGAGLPTVGCYILLATLVAPTLVQMGIDPMAAHMFILYYGCLSLISPPVAVAAFVAANLANADPNKTGWMAMAFGWTIFVIPFLFVYSGTLLLKGDPLFIVIDFVTAVAGVWLISAAVMGYSVRHLRLVDRAVYGVIGLFLLFPVASFPQAQYFNIAGAVMAAALFVFERVMRTRLRDAEPAAPAEAVATPVVAVPTTAEQQALREKYGIRGSGDAE